MKHLKADLANLRSDLFDLAGAVGSRGRHRLESARDSAEASLGAAHELLHERAEIVALASAAVGLAVGFWLGRASR